MSLRIAECDYYLKRLRTRATASAPDVNHAVASEPRRCTSMRSRSRELGDRAEYRQNSSAASPTKFPAQTLGGGSAEQSRDRTTSSMTTTKRPIPMFRELYEKFPTSGSSGARGVEDRLARVPRGRRYAETVRLFERAAADFPRSDYRPAVALLVGPRARSSSTSRRWPRSATRSSRPTT